MRLVSWLLPEGRVLRVLALSLLLGVLVGVIVSIFEWVTVELIAHELDDRSLAVIAAAPMVGLALAWVVLRYIGGGLSNSTSDEYIRAFHARSPELRLRDVPVRLLAGASTIGFGGAVGLEGPSIYAGAASGLALQKRLSAWLGPGGAQMLLTAGAAAGISAVFQAPATGVVFALEAPYRDDIAHRALLPSLLASAASYVTFVSIPFVHPAGGLNLAYERQIEAGELLGAVLIGLGAGLGGRFFARGIRAAKAQARQRSAGVRIVVGGICLGALAMVSDRFFGCPLSIGAGTAVIDWVDSAEGLETGLGLLVFLFVLRALATMVTVGAGGTGGLFIPLPVLGVLFGRVVGSGLDLAGLDESRSQIWPILGLAAFLAAGYRTPLAAVVFVAEWTRGGPAVVPALIAAAVSQVVAGNASVSTGQITERLGHLERRFTLPLTSALATDVFTVPPDATVGEFVFVHALGRRVTVVPVVDQGRYLGMCTVAATSELDREAWETTTVADIADRSMAAARPSWTLRDALVAMEDQRSELLAVTDEAGYFIGVVDRADIVRLDQILDETGSTM